MSNTYQIAQNARAALYAIQTGKVPFTHEAFEAAKLADSQAWGAHYRAVCHMFTGPSEAQALGFSALD